MIAVLDACTLVNLLLSVNDAKYIKYLERVFDELLIDGKVYNELKDNRNDNGVNDEFKEEYERIIFAYLNNFVKDDSDKEAIEFVKKALSYKKHNGELLSVSQALYISRFGSQKTPKNHFLQVHFITDDDPAKDEFSQFYELNHIGRIITSIDLLVIFCLYELIPRSEVLSYCQSLKFLYNKPGALLIKEIKFLLGKNEIATIKEQIIASSIIELVSDLSENTIHQLSILLERAEAKALLANHKSLKKLIDDLLKSNFREKIPSINQQRTQLEKVWLLDLMN